MPDKWVQRWAVRSSSGKGDYIISKDAEGNYACSCMGWCTHIYCSRCDGALKKDMTRCPNCGNLVTGVVRHDCTHIYEVKCGRGKTVGEATIARMLGR